MAYQSKYTGLQIDDILDSVEWKQGKIEDLASIRAGAQKGATALQSYTEKYTGTVTGIKINGVVKSGSGVIDLGTISTDISGKQDKLVDGVNIATINGQSLTAGGDLTIESGSQAMVSTTWAELKELRDSSSLVEGTWYRITDYVTTTSQPGTRSLEHPFDVMVLATGENTLSEEAKAVRHKGDISMSVSLLGMKFFYKDTVIVGDVEWFEFESPEGSLVASSATPAMGDIVYPYYDGMVVTEEGYPIESVEESENEYFLNNNANLDAWKIWYCLDNDKARFPWAHAKTKKSIVVPPDEATFLTAEYNGTYDYEGIMYYRWDALYSGLTAVFLTVSDNPAVGDTTDIFGILELNIFMPQPIPILQVNEASDDEGFGVIYRMIDEQSNDIPYDFKNIQFVRKVTHGKLDLENGTDEFVFTFNSFNENTGISSDCSFNKLLLCRYNNIKSSLIGLNDIVFLNVNTSLSGCYSNTFGDSCYSNTFGDSCYSNTFGDNFSYNIFGDNCYSNTFGDNCYSNTFGDSCYSNTFRNYCYSNTFGDNCYSNTFVNNCDSNTFGDSCNSNTFGHNWCFNTFGDNCYSNTFGDNCSYNTFGDNCHSNICGESADALVSGVKYYTLANSIYGKFLSVEGNRNYETRVAYNSNGELKIYCEADVTGGNSLTIDTEMSSSSTNAVQNKVIKSYIDSVYNDLSNSLTIDTSMSSSSTNAVQNKVIKSYIDSNCNVPVETTTSSTKSVTANTYYKWTNNPTSITITLVSPSNSNILNNYMFEFTASSSGCTLTVPSSIKWLNEIPPIIEPGKTYQISIINNLATVAKFG